MIEVLQTGIHIDKSEKDNDFIFDANLIFPVKRGHNNIIVYVDLSRYQKSDDYTAANCGSGTWGVSSVDNKPGHIVKFRNGNGFICCCTDHFYKNNICKHIIAVLKTANNVEIKIKE